jgi:protocatechuate 3,4-dioxygenase beta subunit
MRCELADLLGVLPSFPTLNARHHPEDLEIVRFPRIGFPLLISTIGFLVPVVHAADVNSPRAASVVAAALPGESGATINGAVTDASGKAVPGATILITGTSTISRATTDSQGRYSVSRLPPGTYGISVTADGFRSFSAAKLGLAASDVFPLNVVLQTSKQSAIQSAAASPAKAVPAPASKSKPAGSMNGVVTDMAGVPIPGARVSTTNAAGFLQSAEADAKGNYTLTGLPPGTYDVAASAPGFKSFQAQGIMLGPADSIPLDATLESSTAQAAGTDTAVETAAGSASATSGTETTTVSGQNTESNRSTQSARAPAAVVVPRLDYPAPTLPAPPPGATSTVVSQNQPTATATLANDGSGAAITGTVTDQTGAVLAGATVTVSNGS